jgi:toxin ParE1/3/4
MGLVRLSHLADGDLDAIRNNIVAHNPSAADRVLEELFDALELLAAQPLIGEQRDDLSPRLRIFSVRPYVIHFYPAADGIHVARVVHGARDFPALFPAT